MRNFRILCRDELSTRALLVLAIVFLSFLCGTKAFADQESEHHKILYLLNAIGSSDLVFIRNGAEYTGEEARDHLQEKIDFVGGYIHTADNFIDYIASGSLITGTPYYVRLAGGTQIEAGIWLREKLAEMK